MPRLWTVLAALNAFLAVGTGAFGAHGLRNRVTPRLLEVWETASRYQMYHALGLLAVAWLATEKGDVANPAGWAMLTGIVLFSGSLYAMTLTGVARLGAITPIGGVGFLVGWALLARAGLR